MEEVKRQKDQDSSKLPKKKLEISSFDKAIITAAIIGVGAGIALPTVAVGTVATPIFGAISVVALGFTAFALGDRTYM